MDSRNPPKTGRRSSSGNTRKESGVSVRDRFRQVERRQWWLWISAAAVTLLLTAAILSFGAFDWQGIRNEFEQSNLHLALHGLVGLVLLFDLYATYQQYQIHQIRFQLTEREEIFRLIGENAADMIAVVDTKGRRLYNSPAYYRVLGYSPEELQGTSSFAQIHPDDLPNVIEAAETARRTGQGRTQEYRIRHKDGSWHTFESTASTVKDANGEVERLVIVNRDITERRQLEQKLQASQRLEAIGRLSGGVAHDFNNLLGVIIGYSEVLRSQLKSDNSVFEAVDEIYKAGQRAASLTSQLLAFSRKQVLEPKVLELNQVVAEMENMLRRLIGEDVELKTLLASSLYRVKADRGQIEQVVMNLAVNARDAMPQGGKLTIETENVYLDDKAARAFPYVQPGPYAMLVITDTGSGIDAETQAHIFEPFFTTKERGKGTGLGLAMVYGVVKQSGGYIWVDSELGKGTKFRIYLPRVEETAAVAAEQAKPARQPYGSQTILLAEDEDSLRKLTCRLLRERGYQVLEASNAEQAIEIAGEYGKPIHLLLTDVVMPGMNGRTLAERLVKLYPCMKVLFMSGYTDKAIGSDGVLEPGITILQKPFTQDSLVGMVAGTLSAN